MQVPTPGRHFLASFLERSRQKSRAVCLRQELEEGQATIKELESRLAVFGDMLHQSTSECAKLRHRCDRMWSVVMRLQAYRRKPSRADEEATTDLGECIACRDRERSVLLTPCGHLVLCSKCAVDNDDQRCPICRVAVDAIVPVHT